MAGCNAHDRGGDLNFQHLFSGFSDRLVPLIVVGLMYLAGTVVIMLIVLAISVGTIGMSGIGALMSGDVMQGGWAMLATLGAGAVIAALVATLAALPLMMACWFAPALVMLRHRHDGERAGRGRAGPARLAGGAGSGLRGARGRHPRAAGGVARRRARRPIAARGAGAARAALAAVVPAGFAVLATATDERTIDPPRRGELVVSFLDVGQGDATLLRRDGVAVLVDTGPPGGPILERLAEAGVRRLDALVITHAQADHEGAALEILADIPTRLVVNGGAGWPTAVQRRLSRATEARALAAHAGQVLTLGGITMRLLWPPPPGPEFRPEGDPNDRALVALVESGDFDLLLPADAESDVTAAIPLPDVDALKVAHHGSDDPGLPALLERIRPEFAAIEVGADNTYGHPTPATLKALEAVDHVYRTDRDGTVHLRFEHGRVAVERSP